MPTGNDGGIIRADRRQPHASIGANLRVSRNELVHGVRQSTEVTPTQALMGQWMSPILLDAHDQRIVYLPARGPCSLSRSLAARRLA
jgi:hypothetical protein